MFGGRSQRGARVGDGGKSDVAISIPYLRENVHVKDQKDRESGLARRRWERGGILRGRTKRGSYCNADFVLASSFVDLIKRGLSRPGRWATIVSPGAS